MRTPPRQEIGALTGLRGVAACWVAMYHGHEFGRLAGPAGVLLRHGYLAVDVFFVLSGFVMGLSYAHMFAPGFRARTYAAFLLRRFARVYPLYAAMTGMIAVVAIVHQTHSGHVTGSLLRQIFYNATLTQAWGLAGSLDGPAWSISTELAAYVVFPLLLAAVLFGGRASLAASMVVAFLGLLAVANAPTPASYPWVRQGPLDVSWVAPPWAVLRCCAEFTIGLGAYRAATRKWPVARTLAFSVSAYLLVIAALFVRGSDLLFVALVPALLLALLAPNAGTRLLGSRVPLTLGHWSFAIYLWHGVLLARWRPLVFTRASAVMPHAAALALSELAFWVLLMILAFLSYRLIEVPGRRAVRELERLLLPTADRLVASGEARGRQAV